MSAARRLPMTEEGAKVLAACDEARQYFLMALDNIDTIERLGRRADVHQSSSILGRFFSSGGLAQTARGAWQTTCGAVDVLTPHETR